LNFDKIEDVYIICVSLESVKHTKETINIMKNELGSVLDERIKGYFNFNREEYEAFCELLYNEVDIKEILDIYMSNMDVGPFINCIYNYANMCSQYSWLDLRLGELAQDMSETLFK
jgi:hypothetical protein